MNESAPRPRITVVTPSFNQGRFLEQCIRSVLDQNYPNLEYFIVDGGSGDESVEVIRKHEKHLAWWGSEKDTGQSDAINKGFARAGGQLIAWLNSDDFYLPGALEHAAGAYLANPQASFYFGRCLRTDEAGREKSHYVAQSPLLFNREAMALGLNFIAQPATFINAAHLKSAGFLHPALKWGLDTDLWLRLSAIAPPAAIEQVLAASREHGESLTSSGSFKRIEELRQLAERYSGVPMTPGALCYLLDALDRVVREHPEVFGPDYQSELRRFWAATSALFARFGADASGTPIQAGPMKPATDLKQQVLKVLGLW